MKRVRLFFILHLACILVGVQGASGELDIFPSCNTHTLLVTYFGVLSTPAVSSGDSIGSYNWVSACPSPDGTEIFLFGGAQGWNK
jgi:hypothetical protein